MTRIPYTAAFAAILLLGSALIYSRPNYDWDLLPYSALALSYEIADRDSAHTRAYEEARQALPPAKYALLVDSANGYRHRAHLDRRFFSHELLFYSIKPLFVAAVYGLHRLGVPLPRATAMPALISFVALGILLLHWTRRQVAEPYASALCLTILLAPFVLQNAGASTPDLLTALFLLAGMYCLIENQVRTAGLVLLALAVLVRVDAVLFAAVAAVYLARFRLVDRWRIALMASAAVLAAVGIVLRHQEVLAEFFLIRSAPDRLTGVGSGSLVADYLQGAKRGLARLPFSVLGLVTGVGLLTLYARARLGIAPLRDPTSFLVLLVFGHIAVRFLLHPTLDDRFLIADYVLVWMLCLSTVRDILTAYNRGLHRQSAQT
jgi:hypothetical protein